MQENEWIQGNEPVDQPLRIRSELSLFKDNPLYPLFSAMENEDRLPFLHDELSRCGEAYDFYYLSLERFLSEMNIAVKWRKGPKNVRGPGQKYSDHEREIAARYHEIKRFLVYDFFNCLLHARILCDRCIGLSRTFISGEDILPSFTSFNDHKKFFHKRAPRPYGLHEEYAQHLREKTSWFDMPLKPVRDKYLVHAGPKHIRMLAFKSDYDLQLCLFIPKGKSYERPLEKGDVVQVSIRRLARDLKVFLEWFCGYGLKSLNTVHSSGRNEQ